MITETVGTITVSRFFGFMGWRERLDLLRYRLTGRIIYRVIASERRDWRKEKPDGK